jgi:quinone-modifying oxidoreductase, subunit QmoC
MTAALQIRPSTEVRRKLAERGGEAAKRCYQCATCSSVCGLATEATPFPRQEMLWAQWGLLDKLAADPAIWLCYQCNDCTKTCPRDARPGDVLQAARSLTIETLATPRFMGRLVGRANVTWPYLLGVPFLFWVALLYAFNGLTIPKAPLVYRDFVPHALIDSVFTSLASVIVVLSLISAVRFWRLLEASTHRSRPFFSALIPVIIDIVVHKQFQSCVSGKSKRLGHMALFFGFIGAALTTGSIALILYSSKGVLVSEPTWPLPLWHPVKILGNIAAVFLLYGAVALLLNRLKKDPSAGSTTAYDLFFLAVVLLVVASGILSEIARFALPPVIACWIYIVHLSSIVTLFITFPYSKFAHMLYRALTLVHEHQEKQI